MQSEDGWSEALRANHLALSAADLKFREHARQSPGLLRRSTFRALDEDPRLYYRQQPWPTFVGGAKLAELKRVSLALTDLLRSVPRRIFQNDPAKVRDFYRLPSAEAAMVILSEPNCVAESMARGDLIDTADGWKCLEINFTPNVGGWETSLLARHHQEIPEMTRFMEREGIELSYSSTLRLKFAQVIRQALELGLPEQGRLNLAYAFDAQILQFSGLSPTLAVLQREFDQSCSELGTGLGGKVIACRLGELTAAKGKIFHGDLPVQVVFGIGMDPTPAAVYRAFKSDRLLLFNGPITVLLSDKRNLALLSESAGSGAFSPEEREVIARHIPWSRLVAAKTVELEGEEVYLPDLLASARDRLVLKEGLSYGGKGVFLGESTSAARWEELASTALADGGWIVQERMESLPYLYQCGDEGCAPHDVIWGPFVFGGIYGGVILRMQPKTMGGAVNLSLTGTEGVVFEV